MINHLNGTELAIIGFVGRFPGARNTDEFWRNLHDGVESISFLTESELKTLGVAAVKDNTNYVKAAATMDQVEMFDAAFFGYSPKEAEIIDPQHRIFLECAWEALENAGYNPETYGGTIGVFGGATINTYLLCNLATRPEILDSLDLTQINIANGGDFLTTRVSYKLNLKGPSHLVQSACSTSLVAVHLACQNLLDQECDMALAGGVSVNVKLRAGYQYQDGGIVSPDGHCRPFDAQAQGTVFGSGAGIVVLKRLADALHDRDTIHAVIKGSAVNNDGSLKVGYTAPSVYGQAEVIAEALANAGVAAETISYVETHGTGTPLGDPVEIAALTKAFRASTDKKQFCAIGSVKSNIGHLDAAAGVASLIKTVLALKHRQLPPSLHFQTANPQCEFSESPFYVNATLADWEAVEGVRRAGVSSFGVGGTNAHVIVEEASAWEAEESEAGRATELLVLTGKSEAALEAATAQLAAHLGSEAGAAQSLRDIAFTLQAGRQHFGHRRAVVCDSHHQAIDALLSADPRFNFSRHHDGSQPKVAFLFPGQGSQHVHMALGLYRSRPAFRHALDRCAEALLPLLNLDLRSVLYPSPSGSDAAAKQLQQTFFAQPALFSVEYALAQMWMDWGVHPVVMLGHSLGEYVAACMAGVLKLEDALRLVAARARLMQPLAGGAMLAVALSEAEVMGLARHGLSVAALNGTQQSVLSGKASAIAGVEEKLQATGVECRRLPTEHAFHSPMMEAMIPEFREELRKVTWSEPQLKYVSNVSGRMVLPEEAMSEEYWVEHVRRTVRFRAGVEELERSGVTVILEVGPGEALSRLVKRQRDGAWREVVATLPAQKPQQTQAEIERREAEDDTQLQRAAGKLWTAGVDIDWSAFHQPAHPHRVALPAYPFQRERFWIDDAPRQDVSANTRARARAAVGKQSELETWFYLPSWKRTLPPPMLSVEELSELGAWIILADSSGVGEELGQRLREMGQRVILAEQGERYERLETERYRVRAGEREDYEKLLAGVMQSAAGAEIAEKRIKVVHLWNLGEGEPAQADDGRDGWAEFERAQASGYYSLLALAQAVENASVDVPLSIIAAANQLHSITSEEISLPYRATMLGPCRVIPQEYKNITCRLVDVGSGTHRKRLINQLLSESAESLLEVAVAYRGEQRWVQSFEPVDWTTNRATEKKLRAGGVYLILGGLEDTGQLLAQHLWETAGAKLVLVSRRGLSPREQWQAWLTRMEQQGAELEVLQADVGDEEELRKVVAQIDGRCGGLHGMVYAAESRVEMSFSPVGSTGRAESDGQFRSKVRTLLALEKVLQNRELDFCMIVSSLSNILGGPGYVAQAAANAFISSFVFNHNRRNPIAWRTVCWDGLRVEEPKAPGAIDNARRSHFGMTTEEGGETFKRILALETATELIVSTENLQARIEQGIDSESLRESGKTRATATTLHPRPKLQSTYVAPASELEHAIANVWQQALGIEPVGVEDSFFELGGDSLIAVRVIADLKRELKQEIPVVSLYEGLTIKSLVSLLQSDTQQQLDTVQVEDREERTMRRKLYQQKQRIKKKEAVL